MHGQERTASLFSLMRYISLVYFFQGITFSIYLLNGLYLTNAHLSEKHSDLIQWLLEFPMFPKTLEMTSVCQEPPLQNCSMIPLCKLCRPDNVANITPVATL